jgi:beta-lactamase class A
MLDDKLNFRMEKIVNKVNGRIGIYAKHIESGESFVHNQHLRFFMASTYKIPIAVKFLTLIEQGDLTLEQHIHFKETDIRCGSGVIKNNRDSLGTSS